MNTESPSPALAALATKLAKILGEVGKVPKSGHNSFHHYDYVTENDLVYAVRNKLAEANIFVFESNESQSVQIVVDQQSAKTSALTCVATKHTFMDGDTGASFSVMSQGQGSDAGDKGVYKAITGAMKYFIYKNFMIPTGDDPEADSKTDERGAEGSQKFADAPAGYKGPGPVPCTGKTTMDNSGALKRENPTVPRDPDVGHVLPEGMHWSKVIVHFGKNKGKRLGDLEDKVIQWYANTWVPKPFGNATDISREDKLLLAGVEAWKADPV